LAHPEPPGYRLKEPLPKPKIGPYLERIAQIIEEDKALPKKQRHTAKRIYERLREMGYGGKYAQVKEAVRGFRNRLTPQTLLKTKNNRKD
jgi:transposase